MDDKTKKLVKELRECAESGPIEYEDQYEYALGLSKRVGEDFDETNDMPTEMKDDWDTLNENIKEYDA